MPDEVLQGLAALGAYGIKIPREYGGLGWLEQGIVSMDAYLDLPMERAMTPEGKRDVEPAAGDCDAPRPPGQ